MSADRGSMAPFAMRTIALLIAVAVIGFGAFVWLSAYADDFKPTRDGSGHALSTSAIGFAGITDMLKDTKGYVGLLRNERDIYSDEGLVVLTPLAGTDPKKIKDIVDRREENEVPTLIVLPKWNVQPLLGKPGWVKAAGMLPSFVAGQPIEKLTEFSLTDPDLRGLRTIAGKDLYPMSERLTGGMVMAQLDDTRTYILADPDLIDNRAMGTEKGAEQALKLIAMVTPETDRVSFDLTLAGFGKNPNLLKLAFEKPFVPLTLIIIFATLLAGWHGLIRFGPAAHEERKVAFGKRAIAENGAALLRLARRRHRTGERYVMLTRDAVATATGAPAGLNGADLDRYLDRLNPDGEPFTSIAQRATDASDTRKLLAAVRDLYTWKRTVTRDNR